MSQKNYEKVEGSSVLNSKSNPPGHTIGMTILSILIQLTFCMSIFLGILLFNGVTRAAHANPRIIGAIINLNTRIGREEKISMEIAAQDFNNTSSNKNKIVLHVVDSGAQPFQASSIAVDLIEKKKVEAILGIETWLQATSVAEVGNRSHVPIISLATPSVTLPLTKERFPFLVRMGSNISEQIRCVASVVGQFQWSRVIAIYEGGGYSTDSSVLTLLSDELQSVGSEIEHWIAFPSVSSLSDPKAYVDAELRKLNSKKSRVFIIVEASFEVASYILTQAKKTGLMGNHSVWITTNSITDLLDTVNSTIVSSMQGIIGIKTHFSEKNPYILNFSTKFRSAFLSTYPDEAKYEPGIYALRAYDSISTIGLALEKQYSSTNTSHTLLENIQSSNFNGLTGKIHFQNKELSQSPTYEIVNVVGRSYTVLKFWSADSGFSNSVAEDNTTPAIGRGRQIDVVYWPGGLKTTPLGWSVPTTAQPMLIGVPGNAHFKKFVHMDSEENPVGFCIDVFHEAVKILKYDLHFKFIPFYSSYNDMVDQVYYKKVDAMVGDFTILANRSKYVDFTQPYAESGLRMFVSVNMKPKTWLFVKPFETTLWVVVGVGFLYTMCIVWFLECRTNKEFQGNWKKQIYAAVWFTFSTQREGLKNNFTHIVMGIWFLTVFIVASSYTASLTSMLTVRRLDPTTIDIETLKRTNATVSCGEGSHLRNYLEKVLQFPPENIVEISREDTYQKAFKNGIIKASFLELPYERILLSYNCKDLQDTGLKHRFGGLGFVFPKGSPIARDFSDAFLTLSEDGTLRRLDEHWFKSSYKCEDFDNNLNNENLKLSDFGAFFSITGIISTIMLVAHFFMQHVQSVDAKDSNRDVLANGSAESENDSSRNHNHVRLLTLAHSFPCPDTSTNVFNYLSPQQKRISHSSRF